MAKRGTYGVSLPLLANDEKEDTRAYDPAKIANREEWLRKLAAMGHDIQEKNTKKNVEQE